MKREPNRLIPIVAAMAAEVDKRPELHAVSFWQVIHEGEPGYAAITCSTIARAPGMYSVHAITDPGLAPVRLCMLYDAPRLLADVAVADSIRDSRITGPMNRSITDSILAATFTKTHLPGIGEATILLYSPADAASCVAGRTPFTQWPMPAAMKREMKRR